MTASTIAAAPGPSGPRRRRVAAAAAALTLAGAAAFAAVTAWPAADDEPQAAAPSRAAQAQPDRETPRRWILPDTRSATAAGPALRGVDPPPSLAGPLDDGRERMMAAAASAAEPDRAGATYGPSRDTLALSYGVRVRAHMMRHLAYPPQVRDPGRVVVALELAPDGALQRAAVAEVAGDPAQARAALAAAKAAAPYPTRPEALGVDPLAFDVRVSFRRR